MYRVGVLSSLPPSLQGESDSTTDLDTSIKGEYHCRIAIVLLSLVFPSALSPVLPLHVLLPGEKLLRGSELLRISMMVQEANSISNTLGKNIVSYVPTARYVRTCPRVTVVVSNAVCKMYTKSAL